MADDETLYFPACNVTEVPEDEPVNDAGFGLFPDTVMVKSDGFLLPPDTSVVIVNVHGAGGVGKGVGSGGGIVSFRTGSVGQGAISGGGIFSFRTGGVGNVVGSGGGIFSFWAEVFFFAAWL
jgi:hypothetical protein